MMRRCSHCNHNGHNSRTCPNRPGGGGSGSGGGGNGQGLKLFGVRLVEPSPMKKSASMGCLLHYSSLAAAAGDSPSSDLVGEGAAEVEASGYASDDPSRASCSSNRRADRKKGTPWTEDEHRKFLLGLQTLGKGDWRGISRKFVVTRTPTQVASHAQKYFIRQTNTTRRRRRSSLFDMPVDHATVQEEQQFMPTAAEVEPHSENSHPSLDLDLSLKRESLIEDTGIDKPEIEPNAPSASLSPIMPIYYPAYVHVPFQFWSPPNVCIYANAEGMSESHVIEKLTPVLLKEPSNADEVVAMSNLRIGEAANGCTIPTTISSQVIVGSTARPPAFAAAPPAAVVSDVSSSNSSAIHAV